MTGVSCERNVCSCKRNKSEGQTKVENESLFLDATFSLSLDNILDQSVVSCQLESGRKSLIIHSG